MKDRIKKVLFKMLQARPDHQSVQLFELVTAISRATGLGKDAYDVDLVAAINELEDLRYVRYTKPGARMGLIFRGIDFELWCDEVNPRQGAGSAAGLPGHSFTFNGPVGAVQTGAHATANTVQELGDGDKERLKQALREGSAGT